VLLFEAERKNRKINELKKDKIGFKITLICIQLTTDSSIVQEFFKFIVKNL